MSREWRLYLEDMLISADRVIQYVGDMNYEQLFADNKTYDAVVRNLEIIGEAANHIPAEVRLQLPAIPWRNIYAMRNILAHAYFGIDEDVIWDVVTNHVHALQSAIREFLGH